MFNHLQKQKAKSLEELEEQKNVCLDAYKIFINEENFNPFKYLNMTIKEITEAETLQSTGSVTCMSKADLLNITKTVKKEKDYQAGKYIIYR
ncbi:hypothetical protein NQ317_003580 [Molorchus minor]|uniref:Uncharacterized protein n=1 Tax=Molorchus minor TaxID=1323400 RepID=A0ABQ9JD15_9CUCU|nr:hypothetical protein NQ317_003580 [Molorchus minor]